MDSHQRGHSAEVPTALAPDQEELRSLAELLLDESGAIGVALVFHKSRAARDGNGDPPGACSSSMSRCAGGDRSFPGKPAVCGGSIDVPLAWEVSAL
jgi:hypothetical protein